ncbi:MAG: hypothetical protein AMS17_03220 [Spirochaetes bacterium DG_61]|nr:MAG: hypothetical protein AMS17_03220 [Spirochaetes bacterium DG_61]
MIGNAYPFVWRENAAEDFVPVLLIPVGHDLGVPLGSSRGFLLESARKDKHSPIPLTEHAAVVEHTIKQPAYIKKILINNIIVEKKNRLHIFQMIEDGANSPVKVLQRRSLYKNELLKKA